MSAKKRRDSRGLPPNVAKLVEKWANRYGVDPAIAKAQAWQESRGNQKLVNPKTGATGVMQLMPATAKELGVNPHKLEDNIMGGMKYMARQLKAFKGNYQLALAAYNAGPGRVKRAGNRVPRIEETQNYVNGVLRNSRLPASRWTRTRPSPAPRSSPEPS